MLSALPYIGCWCVTLLGGQLADFLRERYLIRTVIVRKAFTIVGKTFKRPAKLHHLTLCTFLQAMLME